MRVLRYAGIGLVLFVFAAALVRVQPAAGANPRMNASARPVPDAPCPADFYGVPAGEFSACSDFWTKNNLSLLTLSQYQLDGVTYYTGSFQEGAKRRAKWGLTQAQLEKFNNDFLMSGEGWRLDQVSVVTAASNAPVYAAIWVPDTKLAWENHNLMTQPIFDQRFTSMDHDGWSMVDLASFRVRTLLSGQPYQAVRWSGVWAGEGFGGSVVYDTMTTSDFLAKDGKLSKQGYTVTRFITYRGDSRNSSPLLHAAIWRKLGGSWRMLPDLTGADFQKAYNTNAAAGYRLYYINAFENTVSAIWVKRPPPIKIPGT